MFGTADAEKATKDEESSMTPEHQEIIHETLQRAAARLGWLTRELSIQSQVDARDALMLPIGLAQGPLGQGLADIAAAAEGQPVERMLLAETIQHVMETLFVPLWGDNFAIPDGFHTTPLGQMIGAAQGRLHDASDLMSAADAARELDVSRSMIHQWLGDGTLPVVPAGSRRMTLRSAVVVLHQQRHDEQRGE